MFYRYDTIARSSSDYAETVNKLNPPHDPHKKIDLYFYIFISFSNSISLLVEHKREEKRQDFKRDGCKKNETNT